MYMTSRQRGFTLIELIIFIVVVGAALAGVLTVMNQVVQKSADPFLTKQAAALADSILEEVLQKAYNNPDGTSAGDRTTWDSVTDFNGATNAAFGLPPALTPYGLTVAVTDGSAALGVAAWRVAVTVTIGSTGQSIQLVGYRANY